MRERDEVCHYLNFKPSVAKKIATECCIRTSRVLAWHQVPALYAPTVAAILGVDVKLVRPDIFSHPDEMLWPPLPHFISEPERWAELQRSANDPNTEYGEDL